jgi:hypothetical protein
MMRPGLVLLREGANQRVVGENLQKKELPGDIFAPTASRLEHNVARFGGTRRGFLGGTSTNITDLDL